MKRLVIGFTSVVGGLADVSLVCPECEVVAFDVQPSMLSQLEVHARRRGVSNIRTINGNIGQTAPDAGLFDCVIRVTVIGEVPDRVLALQHVFRVLKPGGDFSITEALPDPHFQTRGKFEEIGRSAGSTVGPHRGRWFAYTVNLMKRTYASGSENGWTGSAPGRQRSLCPKKGMPA